MYNYYYDDDYEEEIKWYIRFIHVECVLKFNGTFTFIIQESI